MLLTVVIDYNVVVVLFLFHVVLFFCGTQRELIPRKDILIRRHKRDDVNIEA